MRRWITWALLTAVMAGCNQPRAGENSGGGGGKASEPKAPIQQTRDNLGDAYVQAARTHASVVRGDYQGAREALQDVRNELTEAKKTARLDTQARINELDQEAIRVQRAVDQRSLNTYRTTEKFVNQVETLLVTLAPEASSPGGGGGPGPNGAEQAQPDSNRAPGASPTPMGMDELEPLPPAQRAPVQLP